MNKFQKYFGKLKKKKASDIKVVALCVAAATTFWVLNALNKDNYVTVVNYPISFQYDNQEYMAVEELPSEIRIEINGNGWDLFRKYFNVNVPPFIIELSNPDKQDYLLSSAFRRNLAEILEPTNLTSIVTDTLQFSIDKIIEKEIQIALDTSKMKLAPYHKYASNISLTPPSVLVKGAESKVKALGDTITLEITDDNIQKNFNQSLPVLIPESMQDYIRLLPKNIQASVEVVAFLEGNKRLKIEQINFPQNVSLSREVSSVMMSYRVDERMVRELRDVELKGVLNYNHRNKQDSTVTIELLNAPDYIESISIEPNTFKLTYE
ncbi:hypothetical protein GCM10028791_39200 [Echinicola sediminis]